ncbi:MAG: nucleotidyltransferase domain-containing protein [bacterium]|nr:nucleotidyltransferase domain-containing protein [bacterium]
MKIDFEKLKPELAKIAEKHGLKLVVLYGSRATGQIRPDSDIDIAVLGKRMINFDEHLELIGEFTGLFQTDEVDIKLLHHVDPLFRQEVMRDGVLLYGSDYDFASFKAYAFRDYMDSGDLFRLKRIFIKKRMEYLKS